MFGLSFGELCVLVIVAVIVIGPKDMPKVLRKAGEWAGKMRRMASDIRAQSGIDEVLRAEGLNKDLAEIRRFAQADFLDPAPRPYERAASAGPRGDEAEVPPAPPKLKPPGPGTHEGGWPDGTASAWHTT